MVIEVVSGTGRIKSELGLEDNWLDEVIVDEELRKGAERVNLFGWFKLGSAATAEASTLVKRMANCPNKDKNIAKERSIFDWMSFPTSRR